MLRWHVGCTCYLSGYSCKISIKRILLWKETTKMFNSLSAGDSPETWLTVSWIIGVAFIITTSALVQFFKSVVTSGSLQRFLSCLKWGCEMYTSKYHIVLARSSIRSGYLKDDWSRRTTRLTAAEIWVFKGQSSSLCCFFHIYLT